MDVGTLAPGEWTRLYVFNPYTHPPEVDSLLGFHWNEEEQEDLKMRDDINLLVFVDGKRVLKHIAFPRGRGDFCCFERNAAYTRERARFIVVQTGKSSSGRPWYRLRQINAPAG